MAAEEEKDIAALSHIINGSPGTDNINPPTPEESEALVQILQEKPSLISKLAETLSPCRHAAPSPAQREEKEAYMQQLENEGKVPEGKVLIRPKAGFVIKTFRMVMEGAENGGGERDRVAEPKHKTKVFVNIVSSDKLARPTATGDPSSVKGKAGKMITVPNVVGPSRMEEDNKGASVPTVDFCVHPYAVHLALSSSSSSSPSLLGGGGEGGGGGGRGRGFKDLLVEMALESAVRLWQAEEDRKEGRAGGKTVDKKRMRRRRIEVDEQYIVLKGCRYKVGKEPSTLVVDSKSLASLCPSLCPSLSSSLPPSTSPPPPMILAPPNSSVRAATAAAEAKEARIIEHSRKMQTKAAGGGGEDDEEEETKDEGLRSPVSSDPRCTISSSTSPSSVAPSSVAVYPLSDVKIVEQGGGREGGREGVDLAAVMVMDAPNSRLRARSSRPHSLLLKVVLPEVGREGGKEGGWVEEAWSVAVAEKELLVESRIFEEKEGGRKGFREGGRKYMQRVKLPYPVRTEEEMGEEGREEGVMMARVVVEDGRKGGAARRLLVVRLLVKKKEDQVVQFDQPTVVWEEGKEGGREEEKEGGKEEKEEERVEGGGGKNHERWVALAPESGIDLASLNIQGGEGGAKERVDDEKGGKHLSILPAMKEVGERHGGQLQQQQQQQQQHGEEEQQRLHPPNRLDGRREDGVLQPDYEMTEEETHFSLLFSVPGIDVSSVQVTCSSCSSSSSEGTMNVVFSSSSTSSSSFPLSLSTAWSLSLALPKPLGLSSECTWQVSSENMWLRVPKRATGRAEMMQKKPLLTSPHIFAMCE